MAFKMQYFRKGKNLSDEGDRLAYIKDVLKEISTLSGSLEQEVYVKQLASEFSLSQESLTEQLSVFSKQNKPADNSGETKTRRAHLTTKARQNVCVRRMKMQKGCYSLTCFEIGASSKSD